MIYKLIRFFLTIFLGGVTGILGVFNIAAPATGDSLIFIISILSWICLSIFYFIHLFFMYKKEKYDSISNTLTKVLMHVCLFFVSVILTPTLILLLGN
ncbi:hypothetical protein COD91_16465 [Bacillus cereus]|nr:hypothetical protein COD91_16465 [Bacillus cereus]